jgi:hypothetical protein
VGAALLLALNVSIAAAAHASPLAAHVDVRITGSQTYRPLADGEWQRLPHVVTSQPCVRYANPWCLTGTQWRGQTGVGEKRLAIFTSPVDAARAATLTLRAYALRHNRRSALAIMARFQLSPRCLAGEHAAPDCPAAWQRMRGNARRLADAMELPVDADLQLFKADGRADLPRLTRALQAFAHIEIGETLRVHESTVRAGIVAAD